MTESACERDRLLDSPTLCEDSIYKCVTLSKVSPRPSSVVRSMERNRLRRTLFCFFCFFFATRVKCTKCWWRTRTSARCCAGTLTSCATTSSSRCTAPSGPWPRPGATPPPPAALQVGSSSSTTAHKRPSSAIRHCFLAPEMTNPSTERDGCRFFFAIEMVDQSFDPFHE